MKRAVARLEELDAGNPGKPITALGIDLSWPGHTGIAPGADGKLAPHIETNYYSDLSTLAFSAADRPSVLSGYSTYGSEWQGAFLDLDSLISADGLEELYGAVQVASKDAGQDDANGDAHALAAAIADRVSCNRACCAVSRRSMSTRSCSRLR